MTNTYEDRQRIREQMVLGPGVIPVLLVYLTSEGQDTYLVPAMQEEVDVIYVLNGFVGNSESAWNDEYQKAHEFLQKLLPEWDDKYLVDNHWHSEGEDGGEGEVHTLPPTRLPPGTVLIQTGCL